MRNIGIVLAGGLSSRMGQDKALLPTEDGNLLQRTTRLLQRCCDEVWISGRHMDGVHGVLDRYPQRGPVAAIHAICEHALLNDSETFSLIFVPVDLPHLNQSAIECLINEPRPLCHFAQHPLPAKVALVAEVFAAAQDVLTSASENASVNALWRRLGAHVLPLTESVASQLVNVNTPEQWAKSQLSSTPLA